MCAICSLLKSNSNFFTHIINRQKPDAWHPPEIRYEDLSKY
jgi:hypothetical protein